MRDTISRCRYGLKRGGVDGRVEARIVQVSDPVPCLVVMDVVMLSVGYCNDAL